MTEEDAKGRWCPFVRLVHGSIGTQSTSHRDGQPAYNRLVDEAKYSFPKAGGCLGSACMAWRWVPSNHMRGVPNRDGEVEFVSVREHGFCGLAGPAQ